MLKLCRWGPAHRHTDSSSGCASSQALIPITPQIDNGGCSLACDDAFESRGDSCSSLEPGAFVMMSGSDTPTYSLHVLISIGVRSCCSSLNYLWWTMRSCCSWLFWIICVRSCCSSLLSQHKWLILNYLWKILSVTITECCFWQNSDELLLIELLLIEIVMKCYW